MKSIILTVVASLLMLANLNGQWEIVTDTSLLPPWRATIQTIDACFINKETGFMVVNRYSHANRFGFVFKTNDGGKSWSQVFIRLKVFLNKCQFANDSIGFVTTIECVGCDSNVYYKTSDAGRSWNKVENGLTSIKDILFINEKSGFAADAISIYKTSNTGESWQKILNCTSCTLNSIFFIDESTGWAVGESGLIMNLTDTGTSERIASGTTLPLKKVFFAERNTGWIAGGYNNTSGGFHPVLLKTVNSGESWSEIENVNWMIEDFYFRNNQEGWAVGADSAGLGMIIETNDGGNNWTVQIDSLRVPLKATDYKDGYGWAVGNGLVLKKDFSVITGIKENNEISNSNTILFQNYPNPFSTGTTIKYQLLAINNINLSVYSITGVKVKILVKEMQPAGLYEVEWNAEGMTPGIYFCELKAGKFRKVQKMVLIK